MCKTLEKKVSCTSSVTCVWQVFTNIVSLYVALLSTGCVLCAYQTTEPVSVRKGVIKVVAVCPQSELKLDRTFKILSPSCFMSAIQRLVKTEEV